MFISSTLIERVSTFIAGREPILCSALESASGCVLCSGGCIGCDGSCEGCTGSCSGSCMETCTEYGANVPRQIFAFPLAFSRGKFFCPIP